MTIHSGKFLIFIWDMRRKTRVWDKRFDPSLCGLPQSSKTKVFPMSCGWIIETLFASDK
jgi:hypothetical protein